MNFLIALTEHVVEWTRHGFSVYL